MKKAMSAEQRAMGEECSGFRCQVSGSIERL
jgi:hypothetical protein